MLFAEVIVDISAKSLDRPFQYIVPETMQEQAVIGAPVLIPFGRGNREIKGFITGLSDTPQYDVSRTKSIIKVEKQGVVAESHLLSLAYWMKENYGATMNDAIKAVMPVRREIKERVEQRIFSLLTEGELLEKRDGFEKKHNTARVRLLDGLLASNLPWEEGFSYEDAVKSLGVPASVIKGLEQLGVLQISTKRLYRNPLGKMGAQDDRRILNAGQQAIVDAFQRDYDNGIHKNYLIYGVTGSGKTEVYMNLIEHVLSKGQQAIMLIPEIALTFQTVNRFYGRFGEKVSVLHSRLSAGERFDQYQRAKNGDIQIMVGPRSALFAPFSKLGLIVIDEEHESSYKQEDNPRYHARNVALWRSDFNNCPLVLGSATPSLYSRARAQKGIYHLLKLTKRANNKNLPQVNLIDLKHAEFAGDQFDLSTDLVNAIKDRLSKNEQVILMLNRRGFANFMLCRECGYVMKCPNCDLSLTMHKDTHEMQCHYCGYTAPIPEKCPNCQSDKIRFLGTGTQKVQEELEQLMPNAKILRMDVDTTRRKGSYKKILDKFGNHEADILLGTQMIAKGLDFPNVTLVGVVNADTGLWVPDYNAAERTFELLTQVAGRAGRAEKAGEVIIQTYNPEHYAIELAQTQDYERFYAYEMQMRHAGNYPPYYYTVLISIASKKEQNAAREAFKIKRKLASSLHSNTIILGPTPSAISRLKNQYYYQILVKYKKEDNLNDLLHQIQNSAQEIKKYGLNVYIDNEPERIV